MANQATSYPATLVVDYPKRLDRLTTFFRFFWSIPIVIVLSVLMGSQHWSYMNGIDGAMTARVNFSAGSLTTGLAIVTALMIVFRQRYPRWWYNFALELYRFSTRVGAYFLLLTDKYPSTEDEQSVHLDLAYPNVRKDLNRWLPLVKWLLAIPHYFVLIFLILAAAVVTIIAWFSILITGKYPRNMFDFVVGVMRWGLRVNAYVFLLITDKYPPFSLK